MDAMMVPSVEGVGPPPKWSTLQLQQPKERNLSPDIVARGITGKGRGRRASTPLSTPEDGFLRGSEGDGPLTSHPSGSGDSHSALPQQTNDLGQWTPGGKDLHWLRVWRHLAHKGQMGDIKTRAQMTHAINPREQGTPRKQNGDMAGPPLASLLWFLGKIGNLLPPGSSYSTSRKLGGIGWVCNPT